MTRLWGKGRSRRSLGSPGRIPVEVMVAGIGAGSGGAEKGLGPKHDEGRATWVCCWVGYVWERKRGIKKGF